MDPATGLRRFHALRGLSRNRNYDALSGPEARRARRLLRRLDGIRREIEAGGDVEITPHEGGYRVAIRFPEVRAARVAFLTDEEHALLVEDAAVRERLAVGR